MLVFALGGLLLGVVSNLASSRLIYGFVFWLGAVFLWVLSVSFSLSLASGLPFSLSCCLAMWFVFGFSFGNVFGRLIVSCVGFSFGLRSSAL